MNLVFAARALVLLMAGDAGIFSPHGEKAVVLLFVRSDCPVSNRYAPELQRLFRTYSPQGIDFLLVYPEAGLRESAMREHQREYGYQIPAALDVEHEYVERAGTRVTPEAAVFVQGKLRYRGRIDDWFVDIGKAIPQAAHHDLEDVLSAVLSGKTMAFRETRPVGCAIEILK